MSEDVHEDHEGPGGEIRFSDALAELESIVRDLEDGRLDLEDSIARYERGVTLLETCRRKLEDAQQRVTVLMGELEEDADDDGGREGGTEAV